MLRKNILVMLGLVLINAQAALSGVEWPKDVAYEPISIKMSDLPKDSNRCQIDTDVMKWSAGYMVGSAAAALALFDDNATVITLVIAAILGHEYVNPQGLKFNQGVFAGVHVNLIANFIASHCFYQKKAEGITKSLITGGVVGQLAVIGEKCIKPRVHVSFDNTYYPNKKTYDCNRLTGRCTLVEPSNQFRQTFGSAHK